MRKALIVGAGNIGRGFLAEILADSDYAITFCDVNETILDAIAARQHYEIIYVGTGQRRTISGYKVVNSAKDQQGYEQAVSEADLIMTAIGVNLLPRISAQMAAAVNLSPSKQRTLMACENAIRASSQWKTEMDKYLSEEAKQNTSFVDVAVDRIVPNIRHENGDVSVEPYKEMVLDQNVAPVVNLKGVKIATAGLDPYISRKLFCVNATHAYVAWLGLIAGFEYVHEAMNHTPTLHAARGLLKELTEVLFVGYGLPREETAAYCEEVLKRFANPELKDTLERVGRNVLRKIGPNERFVTPIKIALEHNLEHNELLAALHAACSAGVPNDKESEMLMHDVRKMGMSKALALHTGLSEEITEKI